MTNHPMMKRWGGEAAPMIYRLGLAVLLAAALALPAGRAGGAAYVHAAGTTMIGNDGRPLTLRGVNTGAWLTYEPFWYDGGSALADDWDQNPPVESVQAFTPVVAAMLQGAAPGHTVAAIKKAFYDNFFTQADVQQIKRFGFNSLRVPLDYRLFCTTASNTTLSPSGHHIAVVDPGAPGWVALDRLLGWCDAAHIYVVLDMHIAPYGFADDPQALRGLENVWQAIARKHRLDPYLVGYDLLNEPNWSDGKFSLGGARDNVNSGLNYVYQQLINAIRQVDRNHMIIAEGYMFADQLDSFFYSVATGQVADTLQITDPGHNLALSAHHYNAGAPDNYDPAKDTGPNGTHYWWDEPYEFTIAHSKKLAAMAHAPLWIGEFGNDQNTDNRVGVEHFENAADVAAAPSVPAQVNFGVSAGWALWTYKKAGFAVISIAPVTDGIAKLNTDYWQPLRNAYGKKTAPPAKPDYMTPEWVYAALMDAARKTNFTYCRTATDFADTIIRPTFNTRAIPYAPGATVPGGFLAVNYDLGANYRNGQNPKTTLGGAAYNTSRTGNPSYAYRQDDVVINDNPEKGGAAPPYIVDAFAPGSWLRYTAVTRPGTYKFQIRYALGSTPMIIHVQVDGADVSGPVTLPATGSWTTFANASAPVTVTKAGKNQIQLNCDSGGSGAGLRLSRFSFH